VELNYAGIFVTSFLVILGPKLGTAVSEFVGGLFLGEAEELSAFLYDELIPRIGECLDEASVNPSLPTRISLVKKNSWGSNQTGELSGAPFLEVEREFETHAGTTLTLAFRCSSIRLFGKKRHSTLQRLLIQMQTKKAASSCHE
jgi:hypothetical protein